jgi:hypothetical protein
MKFRMLGPLYRAPDVPATGHPLCRFVPRSGFSEREKPSGQFLDLIVMSY